MLTSVASDLASAHSLPVLYPTDPVALQASDLDEAYSSSLPFTEITKTKDGSTMTYTIKKFEKNKSVPDSKFVYNPQKFPGYQLIRD